MLPFCSSLIFPCPTAQACNKVMQEHLKRLHTIVTFLVFTALSLVFCASALPPLSVCLIEPECVVLIGPIGK